MAGVPNLEKGGKRYEAVETAEVYNLSPPPHSNHPGTGKTLLTIQMIGQRLTLQHSSRPPSGLSGPEPAVSPEGANEMKTVSNTRVGEDATEVGFNRLLSVLWQSRQLTGGPPMATSFL